MFTLGQLHVCDLGSELGKQQGVAQSLHGIITIFENKTFLDQLKLEQQECSDQWFLGKCKLAQDGSSVYQYRHGLLCKLVEDNFCPVVPTINSSSIKVILSDLHNSSLGGHLGYKKLLKAVV